MSHLTLVFRVQIKGYHGPLIDLIHCNEKYYTAVEQTGGRQMFNAVVDDENVASTLVKAMQEGKGTGRMSFMPLSKLKPQKTKFPSGLMDAEPLSKCVKCDDKFRVAVEQVFGSTLLCATLDVANQYRKEHDLECVTMDGDKVQRKGAIKGGYHDQSSSKLKLNQQKHAKRTERIELDKTESAAHQDLQKMQQEEQELMTKKRHLENNLGKGDREKKTLVNDLQELRNSIRYGTQDIVAKEKQIEDDASAEAELQHRIDTHRAQLALPCSQTITDEQMRRLSELTQQHTELSRRQKEEEVTRSKLEQEKASKSEELQRVLSELQSLKNSVGELESVSTNVTLEVEQRKLKELETQQKVCILLSILVVSSQSILQRDLLCIQCCRHVQKVARLRNRSKPRRKNS